MQHNNLQQIDQALIRLLGQRMAILKKSAGCKAPQVGDLSRWLNQAGVPEFVWQNLVIHCAAATATQKRLAIAPPSVPRRVTLIGGRGKMGRFFAQQLAAAGHQVSSLDQQDWHQADRLLGNADLVLVCAPCNAIASVVQQAAPYLKRSTALADIASIKTPVVEAMLAHHPGPVLGLHPMFGPGVQSFLSQNVVVCPGRNQPAFQWLLDLIERGGGKLTVSTPEAHDRMMVFIQAIRHFSTFGLGVFLANEGVDIDRSLEFSSPIYRLGANLISRLFAQDESLSLELMLATEERCEAISRLAVTFSNLAEQVKQADRSALKQEFAVARRLFQGEAARSLEESDYLINCLSIFLAAQLQKEAANPVEEPVVMSIPVCN